MSNKNKVQEKQQTFLIGFIKFFEPTKSKLYK